MRKNRAWLASAFLIMLPASALANSSWRWFTKTRPHDLLPLSIVLTILLEGFALLRWGGRFAADNAKLKDLPKGRSFYLLKIQYPASCWAICGRTDRGGFP